MAEVLVLTAMSFTCRLIAEVRNVRDAGDFGSVQASSSCGLSLDNITQPRSFSWMPTHIRDSAGGWWTALLCRIPATQHARTRKPIPSDYEAPAMMIESGTRASTPRPRQKPRVNEREHMLWQRQG